MGEQGTAVALVTKNGAFARAQSSFRNRLIPLTPSAKNRYLLIVSFACPWATRCLTAINLKGIGEEYIEVRVVHPTWTMTKPDFDAHSGWVFVNGSGEGVEHMSKTKTVEAKEWHYVWKPISTTDAVKKYYSVRDFYDEHGTSDTFNGPYTVPILYDKEMKRIVNNESSEIVRELNEKFQDVCENPGIDLYPEALRKNIDEMNEWTYHQINNGVYKCGFARTQEAYDEAVESLYEGLDKLEHVLKTSGWKFLLSDDTITETDVRVFQTLIRFDEVYVVYFKTNKKCIREYEFIYEYVKRLYAIDAFRKATNMLDIKTHYFTSHIALNPYGIVPAGDPNWLL